MKKNLFLLALVLIPFIFYLAKPTVFGNDTFYFLSITCGKVSPADMPILSEFFFTNFPCNEIAFKFLFFGLLLISTLMLSKFGETFSKKYGWLAGVFPFLSTFWILEFAKIEDDVLAYPILFLAMFLFLKGKKEGKNRWRLAGLALVLVGGLVWRGSLIYILAMALNFIPALVALLLIIFFVLKSFGTLVGSLITNWRVLENLPILGVVYQFALLTGYLAGKGFWLPQLAFFSVLALINAKFGIHLTFILALIAPVAFERYLDLPTKSSLQDFLRKHGVKLILVYALIFSVIAGNLMLQAPPYANQFEAIDLAIERANGEIIWNDWSYGYYIIYRGGNPKYFGGDANESFVHGTDISGVVITEREMDCKLIKSFGKGFVQELRVYGC